MLKERFQLLKERLLDEVERLYADRLVSVVVFGSVARGTQNSESDLDLLLIAKDLPQGRMRRMDEFTRAEEALASLLRSLDEDGIRTSISPVLKSPEEASRGSPLFLDMVEDAEILFDRDGFFAALLDRLRARLRELGAVRRWRGNAWYWDLKPDFRPGEVFEL
jgi:predicted nucleotidyltransferase